uniref:Pogo transposable element derived with ZNF domain b n=1 Tax=Cyprinodon variegatus TaxID=28743 RepID=A0A3Q2E622_CYPVA
MDTELFMECEEEELEPWQQVDDSVEEDDMEIMDNYGEPVEDLSSSPPTSVSRSPSPPPSSAPVPAAALAPPPPPPSIITTSSTLCLTTTSKPAASAPPLRAQGPPLILTQTAGGTFLLPAAPGAGGTQPIILTAQGFQVPTMMNPGAPLVLNLHPGQTMQPLTLIQSPSLGQLVQSGVGLSTVVSQKQVAPGPSHPGSTFTSVQLPTTLTIRSGAPGSVNLQVSQVSSSSSLKLAASPAALSASTNGVLKATPLSSTKASGPTLSVVSTATASEPPRVVMSVEEFYYGRFGGDISLRKAPPPGTCGSSFTCSICSFRAENNLRLMQHSLIHSELVVDRKDQQCCRFCYRLFSSVAQLKDHQDQVHGPTQSSCLCRICEWAFDNEPAFLNHMKSNHKPGEMPYICQVCSFRSSFYSDVLQHFATFHKETLFLLCVFCLKVNKSPTNYQQHLYRHKLSQAFHCNRCRLQFIFLKEKMQHKAENHRSFRRPSQLDGLPPGSKVTIRTYGKLKPAAASNSIFQPNKIKTEQLKSPIQKNPTLFKAPKSPTRRVPGRRNHCRLSSEDRLLCLECRTDASDLTAHYPTYVHCLLCPYSSCCSRAYATHMISHHVRGSKDKVLPVQKAPPPCAFQLRCAECDFHPRSADQMAEHLLRNPEHDGAICCPRNYVEPDIQLCLSAQQRASEEPNQDLPEPFWKLADSWKPADESYRTPILPFTHPCGPNQYLSKNCDAIDFFNLLFPFELIELITKETNAYARACRVLGFSPPDWEPVTTHEIKGFIGLVILIGIHNLPDLSHYWSFNHFDNSYTFYRAMSIKRFQQIAAHIRMGSFIKEVQGSGPSSDPLHVFRPMLSILSGAMWDAYKPNCCLAIDRALLPSLEEEECSSTQGNPKSQPQVWLLCDSKSGYCHRFLIQIGEKSGQDLGFSVVPELAKDLNDKHHQLFLANSLISIPLMQKLLDQNIYVCSSFPPPNPILPRELWKEGELEKPGDFLQRRCGPFLATRWRDTKEMGCLSTNAAAGQADAVWRRSPTKAGALVTIDRPMAFRLLQENMRGVDICKQLLACNPLGGIPQDRHWRNLFWFLVNLSIVNAFIVLRETRKENPPAWVQDGLFSQVNFRKRLGNQLAKCAQKYFETLEMSSPQGGKSDGPQEPVKQRHRMVKISSISKRCKNCNMKNLRHESVYGCVICKANLCKQPSCFWEFHGLSPLNKGSTKLGFLKDRVSGVIDVDEVKDNVDETMGPVEDLDFSDDEKLDDSEDDVEAGTQRKDLSSEGPWSQPPPEMNRQIQPEPPLSGPVKQDDSLSVRQLRIILFALCEGLRQASRVFSTDPQLIRSWLKEARKRLKQAELDEKLNADGAERMVAWALSMREQQLQITESNLFNKASILKKKRVFSDSFRISYDWAVSFMLRHRLGVCRVGRAASLARVPTPSLELKVRSFMEFTQKVVRVNQLTERSVAAMDELSLFVDLRLVQDKSRWSEALQLSGSTPLVTVYLTILADGTILPALVLPNKQIKEKVLPDFILLEAGPNGLTVEEALDLWNTKVWLRHLSNSSHPRKSLLVLDRHREHLGDQFLTSLSTSQTLPAVIPTGCSFCLQPLDVCLKPVLQRFLLSRWLDYTARNPPELEDTPSHKLQETMTQLLLDWLLEALTRLQELPELWRTSFILTSTLQALSGDEAGQNPEDRQTELLRILTEILLEPEEKETDLLELQELEDRDDKMEAEESGKETKDGQETEGKEVEMMETEDNGEKTEKEEKATNCEDTREEEKTANGDREDNEKETVKENTTDDMEEEERPKDGMGTEKEADQENKDTETKDKEESPTPEEDSEEEGKTKEEDTKEASKERRETRIVIGEEVGDEWKITMKTRCEGARAEEEDS